MGKEMEEFKRRVSAAVDRAQQASQQLEHKLAESKAKRRSIRHGR